MADERRAVWKAGAARDRLPEVLRRALTEGPQFVRRRDEVAVFLSEAEYDRLVQAARERTDAAAPR